MNLTFEIIYSPFILASDRELVAYCAMESRSFLETEVFSTSGTILFAHRQNLLAWLRLLRLLLRPLSRLGWLQEICSCSHP